MRVLYSHRTKSADGQRVHINAITQALSTQGHEVLLCGPEGISTPDTPVALDAKNRKNSAGWAPPFAYELAEWGYSVPAARRLNEALANFEPDIIYERYNLFFHAGSHVAHRRKVPLLLEVNAPLAAEREATGNLSLKHLARWSESRIWNAADAVMPVSEVLADMITEAGVPRDRIHVIPNGVEKEALEPADGLGVRKTYGLHGKLVLGFVGFVRDWHGVDRVIDWLAKPEGEGAHLLLVGDGPAAESLKEQAARLGISDRFTVTGVVQRADVARHIAAFDIALQPAVTPYASPLKLQEYMAQGRCVIAPDQPNIREVVNDGENAILTPPGDTVILHTMLSRLAEDTVLRDGLGAAARRTIIERDMTWDGNARRIIQIAEELIAAKA